MENIYTLQDVSKNYNGRTVLDLKELQISAGEILALVGPSGAGKSTLLRLLAFLEGPSGGQLQFRGRITNQQWPDLAARRRVTMVFQRPQLLRRSVRANVAFGLKLRGDRAGEARVTAVLEQVGLADLAEARAATLSGGEIQRVALARALVLRPDVLLLDEPTANLDPRNVRIIEDIIREANERQQMTMVLVTHNTFQARRLADRVGLLLNGRLVEVSDRQQFFEVPQHPETTAFLNGDLIY